jgi:hypothetical protein
VSAKLRISEMAISVEKTAKINRRLHTLGVWMIATLLLQVLVGMTNNLWLKVPADPNNYSAYSPMILLSAHLWVGTALSILGIWLPIEAFRSRNKQWLTVSFIGLISIIAAFGGGSAYLAKSGGDDVASFMMAVACIIALAAYLIPFLKRDKA